MNINNPMFSKLKCRIKILLEYYKDCKFYDDYIINKEGDFIQIISIPLKKSWDYVIVDTDGRFVVNDLSISMEQIGMRRISVSCNSDIYNIPLNIILDKYLKQKDIMNELLMDFENSLDTFLTHRKRKKSEYIHRLLKDEE